MKICQATLGGSEASSQQYGVSLPSFPAALWWVPLPTACSILTTRLMEGRLIGRGLVQRRPMLRTLHISSLKQESSLGSITCSTPFWSTVVHTHFTRSFSPNSGSTGCFPVTSSRITTPKLYVSLFSFTRSVQPYSAMKCQNGHYYEDNDHTPRKLAFFLISCNMSS